MKAFWYGIATVVVALAMINSASAQQYVIYGAYWQDGDAVQAPSPEQAPADMKGLPGGCGCSADYGIDCYSNSCSGWWANYCGARHRHHFHRHHCRARCGFGRGHSCYAGFGSCYAVDGNCGCGGGEVTEDVIDEKLPEQAPPEVPTPAVDEASDKSARIFSRLHRW